MITTFDPRVHAFAFSNSWTFDERERDFIRDTLLETISSSISHLEIPLFARSIIEHGVEGRLEAMVADSLPDSYGLCGGMAFAALDYLIEEVPTPRGTTRTQRPSHESESGGQLRDYLWQRLIDSLKLNGWKFVEWMAMLHLVPDGFGGGEDWLKGHSEKEWGELKTILDRGTPCPLGLIGATSDPFMNHQILAYGYDETGPGTGAIHVYDSNCPPSDEAGGSTIALDFTGDELVAVESCSSTGRGPLRGFFCEEYVPVSPPAIAF